MQFAVPKGKIYTMSQGFQYLFPQAAGNGVNISACSQKRVWKVNLKSLIVS